MAAAQNPCLRSAESSYRSPGVSWRYDLMRSSLFLAVQEGYEVASSPLCVQRATAGGVLHLVCEFGLPNKELLLAGWAAGSGSNRLAARALRRHPGPAAEFQSR